MKKRNKKKNILACLLLVTLVILIILLVLLVFGRQEKEEENIEVQEPKEYTGYQVGMGLTVQKPSEPLEEENTDEELAESNEPEVTFSGRWFEKEIDGISTMVTLNDGAMIYFQTEDTLSVDISFLEITDLETPYYVYIIDEGEPQRQRITQGNIRLPNREKHTVQIVIDGMNEREDKWNGEIGVVFAGVSSEEGRITAIEPSQRKIIFIGDSITEGIMSLSDNAISDYNSATHSYSWYTAKLLDAEPYFVGFGATGIVATGSFNTCENMLDYYSASRKIPETDFPDCDLAVINTGTNDIGVESDVFIEGYQTVLQKLHSRYPEIAIVCMIPFNQSHAEDIRKAAEAYQWSYVIETADWTLTYSDGIHPDSKGAQKAAEYLAAYIDEQGLNRLWK